MTQKRKSSTEGQQKCRKPAAWVLESGVKQGVKGKNQAVESLENTEDTGFVKS